LKSESRVFREGDCPTNFSLSKLADNQIVHLQNYRRFIAAICDSEFTGGFPERKV